MTALFLQAGRLALTALWCAIAGIFGPRRRPVLELRNAITRDVARVLREQGGSHGNA